MTKEQAIKMLTKYAEECSSTETRMAFAVCIKTIESIKDERKAER